jgi:DNA-binding transcriptional LysR family regulator
MDLRRLQHLLALDEHRHFARAAEQVHLSQPAFSRSIQALELELGQRLFERGPGPVRPTPAGAFLVERARRLQFQARQLHRDMALYGASSLGETAFGAGPFPAATFVREAVTALRRSHPALQLRVEVGNWARLLEQLRSESLEFFVADLRELPADGALVLEPLGLQPGGFYVRAGHPRAAARWDAHALWAQGVATTRLPASVKQALARMLGLPAGELPALVLECDDVELLRQLALATDTVVGLTEAAAAADVAEGRLRPVQPDGLPPLHARMGLVRLQGRTPSPAAERAMAELARAASRTNVADLPAGRTG